MIQSRVEDINNIINENKLDNIFESNSSSEKSDIISRKFIDFNKLIHKLNCKIEYIKSGSSGHIFKGHMDDKNIAIKIVAYSKKGNYGLPSNKDRPENSEIRILKLLSNLVINKETPHIILPITSIYSSIDSFTGNNIIKSVINENDKKSKEKISKYEEFVKRYKKGEYHDYCSILITEWADTGDLLDFIRTHSLKLKLPHWRNIFFQIIATLAIIHQKYPGFRHNDLKANNILLQKTDNNKTQFKYLINDKEYIIPNIGVQIKLWDFDFASIENIIENEKVLANWTNKINIKVNEHKYYDIHYFFSTLITKGFYPDIIKSSHIDTSVKKFILRITPAKYLNIKKKDILKSGRFLLDTEYTTPLKIIENDEFFEIYRNFNK